MTERWRPVVGYEERYDVSDHGRVRSVERFVNGRRRGGHLMRLKIGRYVQVGLRDGSSQRFHLVHRLVLEAFVGPCPEGMEACHFPDPTTTNNRLSNLRWGSHQVNVEHRNVHGNTARGERVGSAKCNAELIAEVFRLRQEGLIQMEISRVTGISQTHVSKILRGEVWRHLGLAA